MKYSDNYQFNLPEKTDSADVDFLSANFSVIDTILKNHNILIGKKVEVLKENAVTLESAPSQIPTGVSFCFVKTKKFVNGIYEEGWLMNYSSENENALYKTIQVWYGSLLNKPLQRKSKNQADLTHIWGEWEEYAMSSEVQEVRSEAQNEIQKHIDLVNDNTSRLGKRITNLEQGITPSPFETDNTVTYQKIVPENALPYAEISKVGGMTRKCENLIPTQTSYQRKGITVNVSADGTVAFSGTSTEGFVHNFLDTVLPAGDYYLSWNDINMTDSAYLFVYDATNSRYLLSGDGGKFNVDGTQRIRVFVNLKQVGIAVDGTVRPMLNEGTTALPYEPHFEGLRSAEVTEVESVGKNLIASQEMDKYIPFKVPKGNVITASVANPLTDYLKIGLYDNNFNLITNNLMGLTDADTDRRYSYISLETDVSYARWNAYSNNEKTVIDGQVEYGSRPTVYKPYRKSTLPIPESVQALDGYGWGINESVYNYVDWNKKQFVKCVGKVVLDGTEQWLLHTATNVNQFYVTSFVAVKSSGGGSIRTLCSHYKDISVDNRGGNFGTCYSVSNNGLAFNINDIADVVTWKAHLAEQYSNGTPVTVVYELTTPIITDISDILFDDNYIAVEGGGTVKTINEFEYAVPSEITYQIKGEA